MTPAARVQAAIVVLDDVLGGAPVEQVLTGWARRSRFAGSGDRAGVRDHVFDALRRRRSLAALGGAETGRGLMLGLCRSEGRDPAEIFTGIGHAPAILDPAEAAAGRLPSHPAELLDLPDWLWPAFADSLGADAAAAAAALQSRAPVHLRVNLGKTDRDGAIAALRSDGVSCLPHPAAATALLVTAGARLIRHSAAYLSGRVELQDGASQAAVAALPLRDGMRVLDYCAGGGGKTLAMAPRARLALHAHDAAPARMRDLAARAARAGARVTLLDGAELAAQAPFDLVLCDVPCSGSGAWRRSPEAKWRLTPARLAELHAIQAGILGQAADLVADGGWLAYATCSLLASENARQIDAWLRDRPEWTSPARFAWRVQDGTDGFFLALLTRERLTR